LAKAITDYYLPEGDSGEVFAILVLGGKKYRGILLDSLPKVRAGADAKKRLQPKTGLPVRRFLDCATP
jgi:hypothetical protein